MKLSPQYVAQANASYYTSKEARIANGRNLRIQIAKLEANNTPTIDFLAQRLLELDAQGEKAVMPFYDALPENIAEQVLTRANALYIERLS